MHCPASMTRTTISRRPKGQICVSTALLGDARDSMWPALPGNRGFADSSVRSGCPPRPASRLERHQPVQTTRASVCRLLRTSIMIAPPMHCVCAPLPPWTRTGNTPFVECSSIGRTQISGPAGDPGRCPTRRRTKTDARHTDRRSKLVSRRWFRTSILPVGVALELPAAWDTKRMSPPLSKARPYRLSRPENGRHLITCLQP